MSGERIVAVGEACPRGAERVDLDGAAVLPGFVDAHVHFPSWALGRNELSLFGTRSLAEAVERVGAAAAASSGGGWLRGRGWRDEEWPPGEAPTRQALDAVAPDVPVALRAHDGHSLWCNSAALAAAQGELLVPGGVVELDEAGEPTGVLREESAWALYDRHAAATAGETLDAVREGLAAAAALGVTGVHDKDGGRGAPEAFAALEATGELTLRVWQSLPLERVDDISPRRVDPGALHRVGYLKGFMDGTLGSRTARLLDGSGVEITSCERLTELVRRAGALGYPVAVHAIGDRANRDALDAFAAAGVPLRHRIEHAQCIAPEDLGRFAALGVAASVQFSHATSDRDLAERIWPDRLDHAYPFRSLARAGALLAGGSDAPVEPLDPIAGLAAAVARTLDRRPPWRPQEAIGIDAALAAFTAAPAWLEKAEDRRGRVAPGFDADLVVLDRDPRACAPDDLGALRVVATMSAGRWTFRC